MKGRFWRKALAAALALLIVSGSTPIQPFSQMFDKTVIQANAATQTVTKSITWKMDGGASGSTTKSADSLELFSTYGGANQTLRYTSTDPTTPMIFFNNTDKLVTFWTNTTKYVEGNCEIVFPDIVGKVTKVELKQAEFSGDGNQKMIIGIDKSSSYNDSKLLHIEGNASNYEVISNYDETRGNFTYVGNLNVSNNSPLKIMFVGEDTADGCLDFKDGEITVTYETEEEIAEDPGHIFSFNVSGNKLTATCNCTDGNHNCELADRKATLTLIADNAPYTAYRHNASLDLADFIGKTGLQVINGGFTYRDKSTNQVLSDAPIDVGTYSVSCTISIDGQGYELTKDFSIVEGYKVNNSYTQFRVNKFTTLEGDEVSITYTQQMDESLDELTLTGATSGSNIAYTQNGNTYTFTMPAEDVNINATITYPLDENDITQNGDTFTIKTADGWDYFCKRIQYDAEIDGFNGKTVELADNITVSTMAGTTHPFKGTFNGKGKTLTFNRTADAMFTAPFQNTNGATIRNLHVTGLIEGGVNSYLGGLVGSANGNLTIENCHVSTQISTTFDSNTLSANVGIGGIVGYLNSQYNQCHITGCVFDGLIYNPNTWNQTYGCGGFIGCLSEYAYVDLTDCLFIEGQYDNNGGKHELLWGNDNNKNSTFFHRTNYQGSGKLTNCFYVGTHGLKQGSPAVESTTAPTNFAHFGDPTTDYGFLKVYGHTMVFDNKYYTPTYGDLVETYDYGGVKSYNIVYDDKPLGINVTSQLETSCVRYIRSFTDGKPEIVMLPFNFTKDDLRRGYEGDVLTGHFYEFKGIELNTQTNKLEPVMIEAGQEGSNEVTEMKANTPYIFVPTMSTVPHPYMDNLEYVYVGNYDTGISIFTEGNGGGNKTVTDEYGLWTLTGTYKPIVFFPYDTDIMMLDNDGSLVEVTDATDITTVSSTSGYFMRDNSAYSITVNSAIGGTVTADPLYAKENDTVTLTVTPNAGYELKSLTVKDSSNTPITVTNNQFTMPDSNVTVTAVFEALSASEVTITKQPTNLDLEKGASSGNILTVEAEEISGHTLSYQWYKNTTNSTKGGSAISDATEASYAVPTDSEGTGYYYCVVTATRTDNGETATVTSDIAAVTVADYSTVIWKNGDMLLETDDHVRNGTTPSYDSATPTKTADAQYTYTFSGWSDGTNTYAPNALPTVSGNVTYTAQFSETVNKYTITWKDGDGNTLKTEQVAYGTVPSYSGATPTKTATAQYSYTFTGWNTTPVAVTGNATYTAQFSEATREYAVTWKDGDGNTLKTDQVAYGETPAYTGDTPTKTATVQYTYTFNETWDKAISAVTGDVTYTAQFDRTVNKYTVTWKNENGTALETDENVEYGTMPEYNGATPTKASTSSYTYSFAGWSPSVSAVTGDVTYTATFTAHSTYVPPTYYTITYKVDGEVYKTASATSGSNIALIDEPTKEGYTFSGWQTSYTTMPASNIEITGTFTINTYAVNFVDADGVTALADTQTVGWNEKASAPAAPTKNGAIFLGWTADGVNAYDFETPVTAETTLTAMWLDASGFITFSEGYAVTDNTYNGTDRDYVGFRFDVNMDNSNYTVVQHGILYGMNVAAFGEGKADANLRFTDEEATALMDKVREFAAQNTDTETTDWIEVYIGDRRDGVVYARGFIIVTDGTNEYLIYSDVQQGSYNSFSE